MRVLSLGLSTEGSTDLDFLAPIMVRLASRFIEEKGRHAVRLGEPVMFPDRPRTDSFAAAVARHGRGLDVVVVHTDGNGDPDRAMAERINPCFESVYRTSGSQGPRLVAAVPVRETEAWMLCDIGALNQIFGTRRGREELGLPRRAREVEQITDPKRALKYAQEVALGKRQARRARMAPLYAALGNEVSLDELDKVPAFGRFASEFEGVLCRLNFVARTE